MNRCYADFLNLHTKVSNAQNPKILRTFGPDCNMLSAIIPRGRISKSKRILLINVIKQNSNQFLLAVNATALKQKISKRYQ